MLVHDESLRVRPILLCGEECLCACATENGATFLSSTAGTGLIQWREHTTDAHNQIHDRTTKSTPNIPFEVTVLLKSAPNPSDRIGSKIVVVESPSFSHHPSEQAYSLLRHNWLIFYACSRVYVPFVL
jgi:hypothetical protein